MQHNLPRNDTKMAGIWKPKTIYQTSPESIKIKGKNTLLRASNNNIQAIFTLTRGMETNEQRTERYERLNLRA